MFFARSIVFSCNYAIADFQLRDLSKTYQKMNLSISLKIFTENYYNY